MTSKLITAIAVAAGVLAMSSVSEAGISANSSSNLLNRDFETTVAPTADAAPMRVAWSIKSAAKKVGRGIKKGAKKVGRGIKKANRVIVPSEIRNTASKIKRGTIKAGRKVGKVAAANAKCLAKGGCGIIGDLPPGTRGRVHDHRTAKRTVHDHRTTKRAVHDHRTTKRAVRR